MFTDKFGFEIACNYNSAFNFIFGLSFGVFILQGFDRQKKIKTDLIKMEKSLDTICV